MQNKLKRCLKSTDIKINYIFICYSLFNIVIIVVFRVFFIWKCFKIIFFKKNIFNNITSKQYIKKNHIILKTIFKLKKKKKRREQLSCDL